MSINSTTGLVTWNNLGLSTTGTWQAQVMVKDGKANTPVDFLLKIVSGTPPQFVSPPTPDDGTAFALKIGESIGFNVKASDTDAGDTVSLNHAGLPSGASFPIPAPANPVESTFTWTPAEADAGTINIVCFTATDNKERAVQTWFGFFYFTNAKTAFIVGQARGVVLLASAKHNVSVAIYTPLQVKIAVTGYGRAEKAQIGQMVKVLLRLREIPKPDDVTDALAVALTHAFSKQFIQ